MTDFNDNQKMLFARLNDLNIEAKTYRHPPLHTVEASQKYRGDIPGSHCKNLFLKDKKGALWLLVVLETARIDLKHLHKTIGAARLSFGKPDLLMQVLGVTPGSVTPFALINDNDNLLKIYLDEEMMSQPLLNYHPLSNDATTSITPADLLKFVDSCGHTPHILDICS